MTQELKSGDYVRCILSETIYKCCMGSSSNGSLYLRTLNDQATPFRIYKSGVEHSHHINPQYIKCDKPKILVKKNVKRYVSDFQLSKIKIGNSTSGASLRTEESSTFPNEIEITYKVLE